ncbi:MAG: DegT/DnrJ/EryC1/StrS family aminotransferase [Anaerolineae bacterium]|nr:DegT/DnrJ/EryC1/StrS family aminotransferase [Anaerolineae bacterium]
MIPIAQPIIGEEEKQAVLEVLESGMLAQGPRVQVFEEAFAEYCGVKYAVATSSGTTALHVALLAHGIGPGDEVITTPFTFIASANSILYVGARPVFVDIDPATFNICPDLLEDAVTSRTKAIMPVHLFGLPADMDPILEVAERHGLVVIEDACQAHGAEYKGKRVGSFGTGCFSFYPTKNITTAEGGIITTNDEKLAERCRVIRQHGMRRRYYHDELGFNFRMSDVHAAIGLAQLKKLEQFNEKRIANARYLSEHLRGVVVPVVPEGRRHVFHQYTIRVPDGRRDAILEGLKERGIGTAIYYPVPVHQQRFYRDMGYDLVLPEAERASREVLSLPVHPGLSRADLERITDAVNELCA